MIKPIDLSGALQRIADGSDQVCMLIPVSKQTTVEELTNAKAFVLLQAEKKEDPKPEKKKPQKPQPKVDHGKIMALHKRGWPIKEIAKDCGCSDQTVYNHIAMEEKNDTEQNSR